MKAARVILGSALVAALVLGLAPSPVAEAFNPDHPCAACHGTHNSPGPTNIKGRTIDALCGSCHGAGGSSSLRVGSGHGAASAIAPLGAQEQASCAQCHPPHGGPATTPGVQPLAPLPEFGAMPFGAPPGWPR